MTVVVNGHGQKYLLVGESPTDATADRPELWLMPGNSDSATRLLQFTGLSRADFLSIFARTNLLDFCPRPSDFPIARAGASAELVLRHAFDRDMSILVLGKRAACAFLWTKNDQRRAMPIARVGFLHWYRIASNYDRRTNVGATIIPHPSAVNLWWNDLDNLTRAQRFFGKLEAK